MDADFRILNGGSKWRKPVTKRQRSGHELMTGGRNSTIGEMNPAE
jgi:hypothetical protein